MKILALNASPTMKRGMTSALMENVLEGHGHQMAGQASGQLREAPCFTFRQLESRNTISHETVRDTGCSLKAMRADMAGPFPCSRECIVFCQHSWNSKALSWPGPRQPPASMQGCLQIRDHQDRAWSAAYDLLAVRWMQKRHIAFGLQKPISNKAIWSWEGYGRFIPVVAFSRWLSWPGFFFHAFFWRLGRIGAGERRVLSQ